MTEQMTVAQYFTKQVDLCGKSQVDIAKEMGFDHPNVISNIKKGNTKIPLARIGLAAQSLGIDSLFLLKMVIAEYFPADEKFKGVNYNQYQIIKIAVRVLRDLFYFEDDVMKSVLVLLFGIIFANNALAVEPECLKQIYGQSVCNHATAMAREFAKQLPMEVQRGVLITSAIAVRNAVVTTSLYNMSLKEVADQLKANNISMKDMKTQWVANTRKSMCGAGTPPRTFIDGGGAFRSIVGYKDHSHFFDYTIDHCNGM